MGTDNNKTVLLTEAGGSICYELSKLFARDAYTMIVVSRSGLALTMLVEELKQLGSPRVEVIHCDLSKPGAAQELYDEIKVLGLTVSVLVNDASLGEHGLFFETDIEKMLSTIQFNIVSLVYLTRLFVSDMVAQGAGKILQLGSITSYRPIPYLAVYAASKAFILSFTDSLINELNGSGVTMSALLSEDDEEAVPLHDVVDPRELAERCFEGLMAGKPHINAGVSVQRSIFLSAMKP